MGRMKTCTKCHEIKSFDQYSKHKLGRDGLRPHCKSCVHSEYLKNKDKYLERARNYRKKNKEKIKARAEKWYAQNQERRLEYLKQWKKDNKDLVNANSMLRHTAKLQRTVSWANKDKIKEYYAEAQRLTELTGITFHVDHIIPLRGATVSGLHVHTNLQIVTWYDNLKKSNKHKESKILGG